MRIAKHLLSLAVIAIIAAVYISTTQPVRDAIMDFTGAAIYKGPPKGVAMACAVRWDSKLVTKYVDALESSGMKVTFFVSLDWIKSNPELPALMARGGNEIALLGGERTAAGVRDEIKQAKELLSSCGELKLYMAKNDKDADRLSRVVLSEGLKTVVSSIDILQKTTDPKALSQRAEDLFAGAIVRFEPTKIMLEALPMFNIAIKSKSYDLLTVSELIEN